MPKAEPVAYELPPLEELAAPGGLRAVVYIVLRVHVGRSPSGDLSGLLGIWDSQRYGRPWCVIVP